MIGKTKNKIAVILGIIFLLVLIGIMLTLAIIYDYGLRGWMLGFVLPLIIMIFIGIIIFIIIKLKRTNKEQDEKHILIDQREIEYELFNDLIEKYAEHLIRMGEQILHVGAPNTEKTPIKYIFGEARNEEGKYYHLMGSLKDKNIRTILPSNSPIPYKYQDIKEAIEKLAENPRVEETEEEDIGIDASGERVVKSIRKKQTQ
ncbi:MAG: hypothetical protein AABY22_34390 [Nanoarchaeota archaeon]